MSTRSGGSGFMTGETPGPGTPDEDRPDVVTERQLAGYRILEHKPPEEREVERTTKRRERQRRVVHRLYQFIDYAFAVLYGLLGVRLLLGLMAANENAGFVRFIRALTQPFYGPFVDIVRSPTIQEGVFELPILVCALSYLLLHIAVRGLLHVAFGTRKPA